MSKGYVAIHRKIEDNWVWFCDPFSRGQAWVDLLLLANHKKNFIVKRGVRVEINRGQIGFCLHTLSERWKWSRGKVERFLILLEKDGQIVRQKNNVTTLISILNYERYQTSDNADSNSGSKANSKADGQQTVKQTDTNNNVNNDNNDNNDNKSIKNSTVEFHSPVPPDIKGLNYLSDGRSYIEPLVFFKREHFGELPKDNIVAVTSFFKTTKKVDVLAEDVVSLWDVFKIQELTEQKPYRNEADVYRHFLNWCKKQSFSKATVKRKPEEKNVENKKPEGLNLKNIANRYD